ncbi:tRNA pseudouridine(38-40) synthase TruA [Desertibacillus haloalkaliphilus]|uniref:tRNA pseudouridine(38-40) synthase TruA n=1 Tax=Desertibacillus haloalkaliphilus TaxID=1328930 RepID=UPI001C27177C|nr:tRNA pseudouridine(38-40) synthase TruA [Desertibacillus haloalkaliphilus]MBU8908584.1 tRNA pseudouridine(38-40) synthase TruA [Desertibacillus haloalkaliphilus]
MQRIKCVISYDGTQFSGYQIQPNARTVQESVQDGLTKIHKGNKVVVHSSGRTDASVHAVGQVIHFDSPLAIPEERWPLALQAVTPDDIVIHSATYVSKDFHARYSAERKEYRYRILRRSERDVFRRHYTYHYPYPLDVEAMKKATDLLKGTHDFTSFCTPRTEVIDKVRTIYEVELYETEDELVMRFVGNGFLYNMVRILVGTLLEVGNKQRHPDDIKNILEAKRRESAGKTAPGQGLYLWRVEYNN